MTDEEIEAQRGYYVVKEHTASKQQGYQLRQSGSRAHLLARSAEHLRGVRITVLSSGCA